MKADSLFLNGKVYTVDPAFSVVEAIAAKDGRILWAGSNEQVKNMPPPARNSSTSEGAR